MSDTNYSNLKEDMWNHFFQKEYESAAKLAAKILQDSYGLDAIHIAGLSLAGLGRVDEGYDWACASLSLAKASADWFNNAAIAFMEQKAYVHAMVFLENGRKEFPEDIRLSYMRGLCMCHTQQWQQAIEFLDQTIELDPEFYHSFMSKGFCLHMLNRYEEAIDCYLHIRDMATPGDREEIVNNHACVIMEQGRPYEALELLDTEYPGSERPGTVYNRSFLFLGMGRWPEAWHMYRHRTTVQVHGDQGVPTVEQPIAKTLDDIRGKHLFLFHEQGLGDSLQFIRYARLIRPYVNELTIGVPKPLARLANHLIMDEDFTIVFDSEVDKPIFSKCDIALPMLDCPAILNTTVDQIPGEVPYFEVPDSAVSKRLLPDTCKPMIGLTWAGASRPDNIRAHSIDKRRSVPFEMLEPILSFSDVFQFVSLQMPDHRVDDPRILQPLQEDFDVMDTMAIVKQLDIVIGIDSSVAHMAGSIGKPIWMLSRYDNCWRWFYDRRSTSPWYPSMRIYTQKAHDTWPEVIGRVADDLDQIVNTGKYFSPWESHRLEDLRDGI